MALKHKLESLDGLEDAIKALYKPASDGKGFVLDMDDDPAKETISKLRKERDELEKAIKEREKSEASAKEAKEREEMERKGEYEKARAADVKRIEELTKQLEAQTGSIHKERIGRATAEALAKHGGITKALAHHLEGLLEHVADGDGFKIVVKGDPATTPDALVAKWKADPEWAFGFNGSGIAGGGTPPSTNTPAGGVNARYQELSSKKDLTNSEGLELVKLAGQIQTPKP